MAKAPLLTDRSILVRVPASTSNLGPGYDSLGCALRLYNQFRWTVVPKGQVGIVTFDGPEVGDLKANRDNLALRSAAVLLHAEGYSDEDISRLALEATIEVPTGRGLGSSSTAIVGGLLGANSLLKKPLPTEHLIELAIAIEGHPDNVVAAFLGGLVVNAVDTQPALYERFRVHSAWRFVLVVPSYRVPTAEARKVIPAQVPLADAVRNLSRTPLVLETLRRGPAASPRAAELFQDWLHQPYRLPLYAHCAEYEKTAYRAGAAAFCISGAGPTMLALCADEKADAVQSALLRLQKKLEGTGTVLNLQQDLNGACAISRGELKKPKAR